LQLKKALLFALLAFFLSSCGQQEKSVVEIVSAVDTESIIKEPPELKVSSNNNKIVAVLGTYSWSYDNDDGTSTGIEADSEIPPRIVKHQTAPLITNLGSEVNLEFTKSPQEVRVNIWNNSEKERGVKVDGSIFKTDEKGNLIYEIYAIWDQGSAHYAVKLNVQ
jgi:hypothetical protein